MVSLIHQHVCRSRQLGDESIEIFARRKRGGGIVGIANIDQAGIGVGAGQHGVQVMGKVFGQRNFDDVGILRAGIVLNGLEGRRRHDELFAAA